MTGTHIVALLCFAGRKITGERKRYGEKEKCYNPGRVIYRIRLELQKKLDVLVKRELYTKYKTAKSATEREAARQEYLEKVGMPKDFRW